MKIKLKPPAQVKQILDLLTKRGFEIYAVGGIVRDLLLNRSLGDWDFATNATPEEITQLIPDAFYDNNYGTVGVKTETEPIQITTFRTESGYSDGRHPDEVRWGKTLGEDLSRRDFTINAMAMKYLGKDTFELIDLFGGQVDLQSRLVRTVGKAEERFAEDALRMMRAVRIATQLQFRIEEQTFRAIQNNFAKLEKVSGERIRDELLKIMASDFPADGYMLLKNTGLGKVVLPEMEATFGVEQKSPGRHHIYDVGTHSVEALRHCPTNNPITRLATLIHDVGKVKTQKIYPDGRITFYNHEVEGARIAEIIADRLKFSKAQKELLVKLVRWHQFTVEAQQTDTAIKRFIRNVGKENVEEMLALRTGDRLGGGAKETSWRLEEFKRRIIEVQQQPFTVTDLKISGHDIMREKQIEPGPLVGKYLQVLFGEVEQGLLKNEREALLTRLKEISF